MASGLGDEGKKVFFVRHAQAEHNYAFSVGKRAEGQACRDARLTEKGKAEAEALRQQFNSIPVELVVTSPLTRALQTAAIAFPDATPTTVCPLATEKVNPFPADMGRSPSVLASEFPSITGFELLDEEWWPSPGTEGESNESVRSRGRRFLSWLGGRKERSIVVITHCAFVKELTGVLLRNCGVTSFMLMPRPADAGCPPAGHFGRFIHYAWASYGGKAGSLYDVCRCSVSSSSLATSPDNPDCVSVCGLANQVGNCKGDFLPGETIIRLPKPDETAPIAPLVFALLAKPTDASSSATDVQVIRADVLTDGRVVYQGSVGTGASRGYISLAGLVFARGPLHPIHLSPSFSPTVPITKCAYGLSPILSGGAGHGAAVAILQGIAQKTGRSSFRVGDVLGSLDSVVIPNGRSSFLCMGSDLQTARIDVLGDGKIVFGGGVKAAPASTPGKAPINWVSLAGITVPLLPPGARRGMFPVPCGRGYAAWAGDKDDHGPPVSYRCENGRVVVTGLVRKTDNVPWHKGDTVCSLEQDCRPEARCVFRVLAQGNQAVRLDVLSDGRILFVGSEADKGSDKDRGWISLAGICFSSSASTTGAVAKTASGLFAVPSGADVASAKPDSGSAAKISGSATKGRRRSRSGSGSDAKALSTSGRRGSLKPSGSGAGSGAGAASGSGVGHATAGGSGSSGGVSDVASALSMASAGSVVTVCSALSVWHATFEPSLYALGDPPEDLPVGPPVNPAALPQFTGDLEPFLRPASVTPGNCTPTLLAGVYPESVSSCSPPDLRAASTSCTPTPSGASKTWADILASASKSSKCAPADDAEVDSSLCSVGTSPASTVARPDSAGPGGPSSGHCTEGMSRWAGAATPEKLWSEASSSHVIGGSAHNAASLAQKPRPPPLGFAAVRNGYSTQDVPPGLAATPVSIDAPRQFGDDCGMCSSHTSPSVSSSRWSVSSGEQDDGRTSPWGSAISIEPDTNPVQHIWGSSANLHWGPLSRDWESSKDGGPAGGGSAPQKPEQRGRIPSPILSGARAGPPIPTLPPSAVGGAPLSNPSTPSMTPSGTPAPTPDLSPCLGPSLDPLTSPPDHVSSFSAFAPAFSSPIVTAEDTSSSVYFPAPGGAPQPQTAPRPRFSVFDTATNLARAASHHHHAGRASLPGPALGRLAVGTRTAQATHPVPSTGTTWASVAQGIKRDGGPVAVKSSGASGSTVVVPTAIPVTAAASGPAHGPGHGHGHGHGRGHGHGHGHGPGHGTAAQTANVAGPASASSRFSQPSKGRNHRRNSASAGNPHAWRRAAGSPASCSSAHDKLSADAGSTAPSTPASHVPPPPLPPSSVGESRSLHQQQTHLPLHSTVGAFPATPSTPVVPTSGGMQGPDGVSNPGVAAPFWTWVSPMPAVPCGTHLSHVDASTPQGVVDNVPHHAVPYFDHMSSVGVGGMDPRFSGHAGQGSSPFVRQAAHRASFPQMGPGPAARHRYDTSPAMPLHYAGGLGMTAYQHPYEAQAAPSPALAGPPEVPSFSSQPPAETLATTSTSSASSCAFGGSFPAWHASPAASPPRQSAHSFARSPQRRSSDSPPSGALGFGGVLMTPPRQAPTCSVSPSGSPYSGFDLKPGSLVPAGLLTPSPPRVRRG